MKKIIRSMREFAEIATYCFKLTISSSPQYAFSLFASNIVSIALPFISIFLFSQLMNLLVSGSSLIDVGDNISNFLIISVLILLNNIILKSIEYIKNYCEGMHREVMNKNTRYIIMEKVSSIDLKFFDSTKFYNEMMDANNSSYLITQYAFQMIDLCKYVIQLVASLVLMANYNIIFGIMILLSIIPNVFYQRKQLDSLYMLQRNNMDSERKLNYISNIAISRNYSKDVRIYNLFDFIGHKFKTIWNDLFKQKKKVSIKYTVKLILASFIPEFVTAVVSFQLGYSVLQKSISMGIYSYYQGIVSQILSGMFMIVYNYGQVMDGKVRIQNFISFIKWKNDSKKGDIEFNDKDFIIEFVNVSFKYDKDLPYILKKINLTIKSGQKIAFVGNNGSGKTTIIKLLLRYYDVVEGVILLNGKDITLYTKESIQKLFSTMFQDYCNYAFNVKESVSLSNINEPYNESLVIDALQKSGAEQFVTKFPFKYDTYLTREYEEKGEELSGGQWQKMALSRTMYRDAPMLILDEPSSSLDAEAEDELFQQFNSMCEDKGAIMVSHRLSNIHMVDMIFVIDNGTIIESGTHAELMELEGKYARMYLLQANRYNVTTK